ncbi:hypothetical protein FRC0191_01079 [Corynebacterium diphtheriae]|nr:hypothetical protein FRC0191_01079 [Corynebacterium diphtheriae]
MDPTKAVPRDDDIARHQRTDPTYRRDLFLANLRAAIDGSSGFGVRSGVKKTTVGSAGHHNI